MLPICFTLTRPHQRAASTTNHGEWLIFTKDCFAMSAKSEPFSEISALCGNSAQPDVMHYMSSGTPHGKTAFTMTA